MTDLLKEKSLKGTCEGFILTPIFLILLLSYLPLGFGFSLVNFTYGDRGFDPDFQNKLPLIFLATAVTGYAMEILLRGFVFRFLLKRYVWAKAFWIHLVVVNLIFLPILVQAAISPSGMGFLRIWVYENLLQALWALVFLRTGSLLAVGLVHGAHDFCRFVMMSDVTGPFETLYFYSAAVDDFYWMVLMVAFVAIGLQVAINRFCGMREVEIVSPPSAARHDGGDG